VATILSAVLGALLKAFFGLFTKSPEERLGINEQKNADLEAENEALSNRPITDNDLVKLLNDKAARERKDSPQS